MPDLLLCHLNRSYSKYPGPMQNAKNLKKRWLSPRQEQCYVMYCILPVQLAWADLCVAVLCVRRDLYCPRLNNVVFVLCRLRQTR